MKILLLFTRSTLIVMYFAQSKYESDYTKLNLFLLILLLIKHAQNAVQCKCLLGVSPFQTRKCLQQLPMSVRRQVGRQVILLNVSPLVSLSPRRSPPSPRRLIPYSRRLTSKFCQFIVRKNKKQIFLQKCSHFPPADLQHCC